MSVKRRLSGLEKAANETNEHEPPWSPPEVYARLREDARDEIARDLRIGEEPLFRIDDAGIIRAVDDGSLVRHLGDYVRAGDRKIERLDREIECLDHEIAEVEANMTPEELALERARHEEPDARLAGLSLDGKIEALEAEIAALNAALEDEEGEGVGS